MKLLTKTLEKQLPKLYEQDGLGDNAMVYVHFFSASKDWYAMEYDAESRDFFGYVKFFGYPGELGYFNLDEMERLSTPTLAHEYIERDKWFEPCKLAAVKKELEGR